jgi:tetratricopeptide (TPR) repeat protein
VQELAVRRAPSPRIAFAALIAAMVALSVPGVAQVDDVSALNSRVSQLIGAGRYGEALPVAEQLVATARTRFGESHIVYARSIELLGQVHARQRRFTDAEMLFKQAIAIFEQVQGPEGLDVVYGLNNLAEVYRLQGRAAEAEPLYQRALPVARRCSSAG